MVSGAAQLDNTGAASFRAVPGLNLMLDRLREKSRHNIVCLRGIY